jgi:uncharacterized membrane protein
MRITFLIIPILTFLIGLIFCFYSPKNINNVIGYRSKRSKQSEETWRFANKYCAKLLMKFGITSIFVFGVLQFIVFNGFGNPGTAIVTGIPLLQTLMIIIPGILTEKALKEHFNEFGIVIKESEIENIIEFECPRCKTKLTRDIAGVKEGAEYPTFCTNCDELIIRKK